MGSAHSLGRSSENRLGRYRLLLELGHGGMGTIHLAIATGAGEFRKLVVLKELREERFNDPAFVELFMQEAMLAGRLNHTNIVQTIEAAQDGNRLFLAMEFLDGQPLSRLMRGTPDSPRVSLRLMVQLLCEALVGLHYAHELKDYGGKSLGIVHCDVSPQNVFVTYDGHVKVIDFGIARAAGSNPAADRFCGRLAYAAPEQILGHELDRRVDVFGVGVILWEFLAQRRLVPAGTSDQDVVTRRLSGETKIKDVVPGIDPELAVICDTALHVDANQRFATAEDFRQELSRYLHKLGGPMDAGDIAKLMSERFSGQRDALHRLIHDGTHEDATAIKERSVVTVRLEPGNEDETRLGDLSPLVELTRSAENTAVYGDVAFRRRRTPMWLTGSAAGSVVAGLFLWSWFSGEPPRSGPVDEPLVAAALTSAPPKTVTRQSATVTPTPTPAPTPTPTPTLEVEVSESQPQNVEESAPKPLRRTRWAAKRARPKLATTRRAPAVRDDPKTAPAVTTAPSAAPKASSQSPASPIIGEKLRRVAPSQRRELDSENPFR